MLFSIGLAKKLFIADPAAQLFSDPIFVRASNGEQLSFFVAWVGSVAFAIQIYFDFSGYSDMALGLARLFGIRLPENFESPYRATSIVEFWRRWHMTLSRFLRDYLYVPLGGNRSGRIRQVTSVAVTMFLGGLWHGAAWTFVFWGCLHGVFIVVNQAWRKTFSGGSGIGHRFFIGRAFSWALTMACVSVAWVFFRSTSFESAFSMVSSMLMLDGLSLPHNFEPYMARWPAVEDLLGITYIGYAPFDIAGAAILIGTGIAIVLLLPTSNSIVNACERALEDKGYLGWLGSSRLLLLGFSTATLFICSALRANAPQQFIYFDF